MRGHQWPRVPVVSLQVDQNWTRCPVTPSCLVENLLSGLTTRWMVYKPNQKQQIPASWADVLPCLNFPTALREAIPVSVAACGDNYTTCFRRGPLLQKCRNSNLRIVGLSSVDLHFLHENGWIGRNSNVQYTHCCNTLGKRAVLW